MKVVIVGGFLGAGKTTLLRAAARQLVATGRRVGLVTNDQAPDLVDTTLLQGLGAPVEEIAGSCFCCNFDGLDRALAAHHGSNVEIVLAEPVGSCTDLASTIIRPLRAFRPSYEVAPLTVLADPARLVGAYREGASRMHADAVYIYRKQLEEADLCVVTKADRLTSAERTGLLGLGIGSPISFLSSVTGEGLTAWLDSVLTPSTSGEKQIEVDYDRYAHGEAVLGWLNAKFELPSNAEIGASAIVERVVRGVYDRATEGNLEIGHVKAVASTGGRSASANVTALGNEIEVREVDDTDARDILILNARIEMSPEELRTIIEAVMQEIGTRVGEVKCRALRSLSPGRPLPTHRM